MHILILLLVGLIKFVESCMRVTDCNWTDPCNKYSIIKECNQHEECTVGQPEDSGFELYLEYGKGDDNSYGNMDNQNAVPFQPLACVTPNFKKCYIRFQCTIF